ncbi:MAG: tryptophan--tRNA ligase [Bacillota bacterium]
MPKPRALTGDRPTGPLHLGHYLGSLVRRVELQNTHDLLVIIADVQALTTHYHRPELLSASVRQVALDNLAAGLDPAKITMFVQSEVPAIAELTVYLGMLARVNALRRNPTIKAEAKAYGYRDLTYGFLGYPVSQAADVTFCDATVVPVGDDQLPHLEFARELVRKFNAHYGPTLVEPQALLGPVPRLTGLDGNAKMSKSLGNCIFLSDGPREVTLRLDRAVTDPARVRRHDPGRPEVCTVHTYYRALEAAASEEAACACRAGQMGCVDCKQRLAGLINRRLEPMRARRQELEKPGLVEEILDHGAARAQALGAPTLARVRASLKLRPGVRDVT